MAIEIEINDADQTVEFRNSTLISEWKHPTNENGEKYVTEIDGEMYTQADIDEFLDKKMPHGVRKNFKQKVQTGWIERPQFDSSTWRRNISQKAHIKFTDAKKGQWLYELKKHGQPALADAAVGINKTTRMDHLNIDPQFKDAEEQVMERYSAEQVRQLEAQALEGEVHEQYDKDGNLVGKRRVFETPLRLAVIRRHDRRFGEYKEVEHSFKGGVLLMPAATTASNWEASVADVKSQQAAQLPPGADESVIEAEWEAASVATKVTSDAAREAE